VVLLTEGGAKTAPAWLTSLAIKYKEGKVKRVVFGHARTDDEPAIAARFGITSFPALVAVVPSGSGGDAVRFAKPIPASAAAALRELREFVDAVLAGDDAAEQRLPAPAFPAPDVPRKQADVAYAPLTEDNLRTACLGGKKSMCVLALVAAPGGEFRQDGALQELARKYRNGAHTRPACASLASLLTLSLPRRPVLLRLAGRGRAARVCCGAGRGGGRRARAAGAQARQAASPGAPRGRADRR